ncbi:MAG: DNA-binding response regulator [Leptolyngbya sp.]|nr:MAG: DNA-binding response regulator [Leptolyngbya sp.]
MGRARILIAEDEILVAREIESQLGAMGYSVVGTEIAADGGLAQVAEASPDLVLMDINLSGTQDGIALAGEIRDRFQIPIVYMTAYTDPATLEWAKATHPFGYVLKPFTETDLRVTVELALFRLHSEATHQNKPRSPATSPSESSSASPATLQPNGLPASKLRKVLDYVDDHLNQELSLETMASEVGLTTYYFARLFKQSTGKSFHQYVIYQRVEPSKQLLQQSESAIAQIAAECGFANPSPPALHFKRIVGVTPKNFRYF